MPKAKKPYVSFETVEEFDKILHRAYQDGYDMGFKDGREDGLAHVIVGVRDQLAGGIIANAINVADKIEVSQWKRRENFYDDLKKSAVEEYIKSQSESGENNDGKVQQG